MIRFVFWYELKYELGDTFYVLMNLAHILFASLVIIGLLRIGFWDFIAEKNGWDWDLGSFLNWWWGPV